MEVSVRVKGGATIDLQVDFLHTHPLIYSHHTEE